MIDHVADLMDLATLDQPAFAGHFAHGRGESLTAIQNVQTRHVEIHPAAPDVLQQVPDYGEVLGGALVQAENLSLSSVALSSGWSV
jgi:hypothetical protein